ncbi:MAG: STAS domain-containing protein [Spirochaetia bacterium]|nr:STAS domain-containing protein [Spirochaetia bacterium]
MNKNEWEPKLLTLIKEGFDKEQIKKDIISGIIVGIIALPLAIAFAIASGVSPETGLITAIIGGLIVSLLGGSRVQIGGPTGAFIVIIVSIISRYGIEGLLISTFLAGIILILMGLFKMGSFLKYIPQTLITGFTGAIAIIIFVTQINDFLGLPNKTIPSDFIEKLIYYGQNISQTNFTSLLVGLSTIFIITLIPRFTKKVPSVFIALVFITIITTVFKIPVETIGDRFSDISFQIPQFKLLNINLDIIIKLLPSAFSIALLGALESLLSAVVADSMIGGHHRSNVELIAMGIANTTVSLFGGIPVTGAIARTAANINNGGRTPIAGIVHALTLFLIYLIAMPIVKFIPMSALAGILIIVAYRMSEPHVIINSLKINRYESTVLITTFGLTLLTDLTIAIPVGFMLSVILFMKRMADSVELNPLMYSKVNDQLIFSQELGEYDKRIRIVEINGPMFFGSVFHLQNIEEKLDNDYKFLILRFRYVPIVDSDALAKLKILLNDMKKKNIQVYFTGLNDSLKTKFIKQNIIKETSIFDTIDETLNTCHKKLNE